MTKQCNIVKLGDKTTKDAKDKGLLLPFFLYFTVWSSSQILKPEVRLDTGRAGHQALRFRVLIRLNPKKSSPNLPEPKDLGLSQVDRLEFTPLISKFPFYIKNMCLIDHYSLTIYIYIYTYTYVALYMSKIWRCNSSLSSS